MLTSLKGRIARLRAVLTTKRVLVVGPAVVIVFGIVQGVIIRTEWLTKPLMKAPAQISGEASSVDGNGSKDSQDAAADVDNVDKTRLARMIIALDDIIAQAKQGSVLETLKGKGREILKDFEHLSKREKGDMIDVLKGRVQKTGDQLEKRRRAIAETVVKAASDLRERLRMKGDQRTQKADIDSMTQLEKIAKIMKIRDAEEKHNSRLMLEIGSVLDAANSTPRRKIKILFIGDSLSACVGVDKTSDGPVLQETVANYVQQTTGCDVEWYNSAVVGGTVREIRDKLGDSPFLKDIRKDEDLVVVLICGLNDYKRFLFSLWNPLLAMQSGPMSFKSEILSLMQEIREECVSDNSSVFLPAIPVKLMASDPKFLFSVFPLNFMGLSLNTVWEIQKYNIAFEQQAEAKGFKGVDNKRARSHKNTFYITEPDPETADKDGSPQETSDAGTDAVAKDGVHLSSNGYKLWGRHLAHSISLHLMRNTIVTAASAGAGVKAEVKTER